MSQNNKKELKECYWNHRVLRQTINRKSLGGIEEYWYSVREVHYNPDGSIYGYTQEPVNIQGSSVEEIKEYCQWILNCMDKEVLIEEDIVLNDRN
jgi:hypothetical protein